MRSRALLAASAFFALTGVPRALAQAAPAPAAEPIQEEQVIRMDPFTVTTETEGYKAVDTLGGARVQTSLKDTPSAISVVTKSFLDDTGITDAQDLFLYTTNTEVAGLNGNFSGVASRGIGVSSNAESARLQNPNGINRSRGLSPMDNTRNYFSSEIPWDSFNISRIDISRGPNSFLFGVGSPSGIANYSTNEAIFKNEGSLEFRVGAYGTHRESLDFNMELLPGELAARIDLLNDDTEYRQKPAFNHAKRAFAALRYDPKFLQTKTSHLKIQLNAEAGRDRSNNPRELPPMDFLTGYFTGGGLNKAGYDPFIYCGNQSLTGVGSFSGTGSINPVQPSLNPWINMQDYHYMWPGPGAGYWYDATTGQLLQTLTTFNGFTNVNGGNNAIVQAMPIYISGFANFARTVNFRDPTIFPGAYAGTVVYNDKSLGDPSIFDYNNLLIDGPNKQEWQNWNTFNATVEQTLFNGRVAVQAVVDHQEFDQGAVSMFGYTEPFISVDMDANSIIYPSWYPSQVVANANQGRPFVASDTGSGANSSKFVHDNYQLTVNAELRAEDIMPKGPLADFFGRHSFTGLVGHYRTQIETRAWDTYAQDEQFTLAMNATKGTYYPNLSSVSWAAYIGPRLVNAASASGLYLGNLANPIVPSSGTQRYFDNTWVATGVNPTDPWTDPSPYATNPSTQANNLANYRGWSNYPITVLNWHDNINDLYTSGNKTVQLLRSAAFMYQGHLWNDVIVPEFGVRRDIISQRSANAPLDPNTHVASMNYRITDEGVKMSTNSTSWGVTLHLPKGIRGTLPSGTDVSVYYFRGNNQTPKIRYAFDASLLPSEKGQTDDYGLQVDTLNGHATLRVTYFKTVDQNAPAGSGAADPLGNNGYYLYLLPAWGAADAAGSGLEPTAPGGGGGFATNTGNLAEQAAAVADWRAHIAQYFPQSFFDAYGLGVNVAALQNGNYANVYNNPGTYPYPWVISNTGGGKINGSFPIITQDIEAKGWEIEATVRPVSNWDLTFNASKLDAVQTALGAADTAFIESSHTFFNGPAGKLPLWGYWNGPGGGTGTLQSYFNTNIWAAYQLQSAQTGAAQPELSKWNFKGITNYNFVHGMLKGFNVGGAVRWQSAPILGYGVSQVTSSGVTQWIMDVNKPLSGVAEKHFDLWIGYQRKLSARLNWRIQLNVRNVGERAHLVPVSVEPDGTYAQQRIEMGQSWELTNKLSF